MNAILILVDTDNNNLNYQDSIQYTKSKIVKYFGTKNVSTLENVSPIVYLNCEFTKEDLLTIKKELNESIHLIGFNNFKLEELINNVNNLTYNF